MKKVIDSIVEKIIKIIVFVCLVKLLGIYLSLDKVVINWFIMGFVISQMQREIIIFFDNKMDVKRILLSVFINVMIFLIGMLVLMKKIDTVLILVAIIYSICTFLFEKLSKKLFKRKVDAAR